MNQKIVAVLLIFVIISITPASAVEYSTIQNDIESIKYSQQHFGFWQCFKLMGKVYDLMKHVSQIDISPLTSQSKVDREKIKIKNKERQLQRTALIKYLANKDRIENINQINHINTKKLVNNDIFINKVKPRIKESNPINGTENSINDSNQVNKTQNFTTGSNQVQRSDNITPINNTAIIKEEMVEAPEQAVKHADQIKSKLNEKGLKIKINNTHGSIDVLKSNDIVQLIESHGYIKYWIFKGINNNTTDNKVVSLYNGKTDVNVSLRLFKQSFTGIVMNLDGDYKIKKPWKEYMYHFFNIKKYTQIEKNLQSLTNTETDKATEYDVIDEIYQIQKKDLEDSINKSGSYKVYAGLLKGIGIGLSILGPIIIGVGTAFFAIPEAIITKFAAFVLAIIGLIILGVAMAAFFSGLGWETDILFKESLEKNELANLESRELT
ncbi:MAG: hypothetical protein WAK14_03630 [Methanobacterium sp.]